MERLYSAIMLILAEALLNIQGTFALIPSEIRQYIYALGILALLSFIIVLLLSIKKKIRFFAAASGLIVSCASVYLFVIAPYAGTVSLHPEGDPKAVVNEFFTDICLEDYEAAHALTDSRVAYGVEMIPENDLEECYIEKLRAGYSYEMIGEPLVKGLRASQNVKVRYFNMPSTGMDVKAKTMANLDDYVQSHPKDEVYDEKNNYLDGITDLMYERAVKSVVGGGKSYFYSFDLLQVEMEYTDGRWQIVMDDELKNVLNGGTDNTGTFCENAKSDALSEVIFIPKTYVVAEEALWGPAPDQALFGKTDDPEEVQAVVDTAWELLGDQELSWSPSIKIVHGTYINYYCDDTILAITWRQRINGEYCTCAEVKILDPSQLRRKLSMDTFGSPVEQTASALARQANAVLAVNGDYYKYRGNGICVYQRELCRAELRTTDTCYFNTDGEMLFTKAGQFKNADEVNEYIDANDVLFAVSFGPVLVDNGEIQNVGYYALGQVHEGYSRSAIGQIDELHYFMMNINHTKATPDGGRIESIAQYMYDFGCQKAYALDGGQTAELVMNGYPVNPVDWSSERMVSDIIYFSTAMPETEEAE
ncbi:MAG: phosphodiester glycosidase family protein [Lachnospiraceae bacterium]|nr:phosphodiester glycosidase family protein [Lachnospiraceae bacterium]